MRLSHLINITYIHTDIRRYGLRLMKFVRLLATRKWHGPVGHLIHTVVLSFFKLCFTCEILPLSGCGLVNKINRHTTCRFLTNDSVLRRMNHTLKSRSVIQGLRGKCLKHYVTWNVEEN